MAINRDQSAMIDLLERVCELLETSEESDWSPLSPKVVQKYLEKQINKLKRGKRLWPWAKFKLSIEFEVASTLQEIAMTNGWHDEYVKLASDFDRLIKRV